MVKWSTDNPSVKNYPASITAGKDWYYPNTEVTLETEGAAKMADKPRKVKVPPGYIDLAFMQTEGKAVKVGKYTAVAVETAHPKPKTTRGGVVIFVSGMTLNEVEKGMASAVVPPAAIVSKDMVKALETGAVIHHLDYALLPPSYQSGEGFMGFATDTPAGVILLVPSVTLSTLRANIKAHKEAKKK